MRGVRHLLGCAGDLVGSLPDILDGVFEGVRLFEGVLEEVSQTIERLVQVFLDLIQRIIRMGWRRSGQIAGGDRAEALRELPDTLMELLFKGSFFRDVVVDGEHVHDISLLIEKGNIIALDDADTRRELEGGLAPAVLAAPHRVRDALPGLVDVVEVPDGEVSALLFGETAHLLESPVDHPYGQVRVPEEDRHRVLLNDRVRLLLKHLESLHLQFLIGDVLVDGHHALNAAGPVGERDAIADERENAIRKGDRHLPGRRPARPEGVHHLLARPAEVPERHGPAFRSAVAGNLQKCFVHRRYVQIPVPEDGGHRVLLKDDLCLLSTSLQRVKGGRCRLFVCYHGQPRVRMHAPPVNSTGGPAGAEQIQPRRGSRELTGVNGSRG